MGVNLFALWEAEGCFHHDHRRRLYKIRRNQVGDNIRSWPEFFTFIDSYALDSNKTSI